MPAHNICSLCHDIPDEADAEDPAACTVCHTRLDYLRTALPNVLKDEMNFSHAVHLEANLECAVCHENPDRRRLVSGPTKRLCMDCHEERDSERLNECGVCHTTITKDTVPQNRYGMRIAHDSPDMWERLHGHEFSVDPSYCSMCHTSENFCEDCHQRQAPKSHTVSWQRKTHGLQATWDRNACSTCHEEDSCIKCHRKTKPASHRGRFDAPANNHCLSCHFPEERTGCTVCHESIEHRSATRSPHLVGTYPPNCAECHPGGLPRVAPHFTNSSIRCVECHG